jgi:cell fate regulator YaaT (PSP1 superfamily)
LKWLIEMDNTISPVIIGVRFSKVGKVYHFYSSLISDLQIGDMVVVETSRGWQLGSVAQLLPTPGSIPEGLRAIDRRATPRDLLLRQTWQSREGDVVTAAKARSNELNLNGVKIVSAEFSLDGTRLTIMFSTETEEKVELKSLRQDMQRAFAPAQVEFRQIGPRDVAKLLCGMGACGLEQRCCSQFLCEFSSISIRMAKEQGISLTPTEITGMCGRLRCCLIYEFDQYVEARNRLPKRNKRVMTAHGEGRVLDIVPLRDAVIVEFPEGLRKEIPREELNLLEEGEPARPYIAPVGAEKPAVVEEMAEEAPFTPPARQEQRKPSGRPHPRQAPRQERPNTAPQADETEKTGKKSQVPPRRRGNRRPGK